ncbi:MAG TPA: helix-turn-helix domain-containing protein [Ktedonobacteraceae bacterium]|nr:helix-turn-helix domain-containing protein [Ktedonobacteraceae bacterium]
MAKQSEQMTYEVEPLSECLPGYVTVNVAARIIGVSPRSVYGYLKLGKLSGVRVGPTLLVNTQEARAYKCRAPGRARTFPPRWHTPPRQNPQYLTILKVRLRLGQDEALAQKLREMRAEHKHLLPGTAARYIARSRHDPNDVIIVLVWRDAALPPEVERETAFATLRADLAEILDWETATGKEDQVLLHA